MTNENLSDEELFMSDGEETTQETEVVEAKPDEVIDEVKPEGDTETLAETVEATPETETPVETAESEKVEAVETEDENKVPSWRLREINEAKKEAEAKAALKEQELHQTQAQLSALQQQINQQQTQPQTPPNVFDDPDGYAAHQEQLINNQSQQVRMQMAQLDAKVTYGVKEVEEAVKAAEAIEFTLPHVAARIKNAPNPWAEAVQWHKEQQTQQAIGEGGIDAFRQREREALMADPEFRKQVMAEIRGEAGGKKTQPIETIPSLNGVASASVNSEAVNAITDEELFLTS